MNYEFSMQAIGQYKRSNVGGAVKSRDYKDATDLIVTEQVRAADGEQPSR